MRSYFTPRNFPKRNEICLYKGMHINAHNIFIHNSQKLATTQISIKCLTDEQTATAEKGYISQ